MEKIICTLLVLMSLACQRKEDSSETITRVIPLGKMDMDIRQIELMSYKDDVQSPNQSVNIHRISVDTQSWQLSIGGRNISTQSSCQFQRALTTAEYEALRGQAHTLDLCRLEVQSSQKIACPEYFLSEGIFIYGYASELVLTDRGLQICSPGPNACSLEDFRTFQNSFLDLFRTDFDSCL